MMLSPHAWLHPFPTPSCRTPLHTHPSPELPCPLPFYPSYYLQLMLFASITFGSLLLFLLLPSLFRLFLEFPSRLIVHGVRCVSPRGFQHEFTSC